MNSAFVNRRFQFDFGIGYSDDIEVAKKRILETVTNIEGVLAEPAPDVMLVDLAGSSVNIRARWWINQQESNLMVVQDKVLSSVKRKLDENGIDIPFPTHTVYLHNPTT